MNSSAALPGDSHVLKCELAHEVLRSSGSLHLQATGWSMLPAVFPGDTLLIEPTSTDDMVEGDVVMFSNGRRFVAHRIVARSRSAGKSRVHTQGDAVPCPDSPLAESDLLGKVSFVLRNGKRVEPSRRPRFSERALAAVLRRSTVAARVIVGVHGLLHASHSQSRQQTSLVKTQ
ncbi:MAG: S24/S26 family peptidase [Candidatus Sulfotelmatobacter sp.]|jgi:signal peptidase I